MTAVQDLSLELLMFFLPPPFPTPQSELLPQPGRFPPLQFPTKQSFAQSSVCYCTPWEEVLGP